MEDIAVVEEEIYMRLEINSTILEIVSEYPKSEDFFREFDKRAGKCVLCHNLFDTIGEFCKEYELDSEEVLLNLKLTYR